MSSTLHHYDERALITLNTLFGAGFIDPDTQAWAQTLCQELDLSGKKVLDFGCGSGGVACQVASQCDAQVTGFDASELLIAQAKQLATQSGLTHKVTFEHATLPLALAHKVDLIISHNTISHYKEKDNLFLEFKRLLKPNGTVMISDWFCKSARIGEDAKAFFEFTDAVFYLNTAQDYLQLLEKNNFSYVNFKESTKTMRDLCEKTLLSLKTEHEGELVARLGAEYYEWWVEYWSLLHAAFQAGDLLAGQVRGVKA